MKNIIEGIKDFFYDAIDYILIVFIIVAVVGVIGWRLDILFTKSPVSSIDENNIIVSEATKSQENDDNKPNENIEESENEQIDSQEDLENKDDEDSQQYSTTEDVSVEVISVEIPSGSLATSIAKILYDKGLIDDKNQFLIKAQELGLDTKLKSGTFQIKSNSSLETIIKIIAN